MTTQQKNKSSASSVDTKEFDFPETVYVRDIENKVFQTIVYQCLSSIKGIFLLDGGLFDNLLEKGGIERAKGVLVDQDNQKQTVNVKIEVNIKYGIPIPQKAEEIQTKISEEINRLTALHVSCVHVIFKGVLMKEPEKKLLEDKSGEKPFLVEESLEEEFAGEFS